MCDLPPAWLGLPGASNSQNYPQKPQAISHLQFSVSSQGNWSRRQFPLMSHCSGKSWLPVFNCVSLQSWGLQFALCLPFSYRFKKSYILFYFYVLLGWLLSFFQAELETRSPLFFSFSSSFFPSSPLTPPFSPSSHFSEELWV